MSRPSSQRMSRRGRHPVRDRVAAIRGLTPVLLIGAVVVLALGLVAALIVSAAGPGHAGELPGSYLPPTARVQTLAVPSGYVPPATDPRGTAAPTRVPAVAARRPVAGGWTPAIGVAIANRALRWLNTPYSWDAGNADGPTLGRAVDHDSRNDDHVRGFDCSGLVLYALAPWLSVDHSAAAQYVEAGSVHPTFSELQPGDLIFWTPDGTIAKVGHVAIYIGNGNVVQAPQSGDVVKITPVGRVEAGVIGTTRPLTA